MVWFSIQSPKKALHIIIRFKLEEFVFFAEKKLDFLQIFSKMSFPSCGFGVWLRDGGFPRRSLRDWIGRAGSRAVKNLREAAQRSNPKVEVKGLPMGACHYFFSTFAGQGVHARSEAR
ncbi:MAG: hypothetical protein U0I22_04735 [Treponema sp.]|nr:hypothetical protein [Treponema sp.]